jgi:myosin heavy subunit
VNPYKPVPLYSPDIMQAYFRKAKDANPPHLFALADKAYRSLRERSVGAASKNQSILCTGESGAGKTESTKKIIQYLTAAAADMHGASGLVRTSREGELMGPARCERCCLCLCFCLPLPRSVSLSL